MLRKLPLFASASLIAVAAPALAQEAPVATAAPAAAPDAAAEVPEAAGTDIVVVARKREERLQDIPIAVTAVTGDVIEKRGLTQVKDVAALTPSLNVNSDSVGRVFLAVRGVGTTLVGTVQPGVGIFVDGVYQPNTSYLNNPLVDVDRVEVLRGPQGTLYGKNTLGGALNVITRQPSNATVIRGGASYAGPDNAWDAFGSISGPIIRDRLQVRIAGAHREQEGFVRNALIGTDANLLNMDSINATIRAEPINDVVLTVNGYHDWVKGGNIPYSHIDGPTDYSRTVLLNASNIQHFKYKGVNGKLQAPVGLRETTVTLVGSYDQRDGRTPDLDIDFNAVDIGRQESTDRLKNSSAELRFDSKWSDRLSSLIGFYTSRETLSGDGLAVLRVSHPVFGPITQVNGTRDTRKAQTYAAFGTLFWKPADDLEASFGLRVDHEKRRAGGALGSTILFGTVDLPDAPDVPVTAIPVARIKSTEILPKVSLTKHWTRDFMTYASLSKGFRGGGFNGPTAPFRTYSGDKVWTYELGSKLISADRRLSLAGAIFYNDYKNYIGLNQFVTGTNGAAVTVDLNAGDVRSYGAEIEATFKPSEAWTLSGGASYVHARIVDSSIYQKATASPTNPDGLQLASDRLPFQPDWTFNLGSDYVVPVGKGDLSFFAGIVAKGSRIGASISETRAPVLKRYALVNTALTYSIGGIEVGAFVNNLFNAKYYESFIEKTTLENVFGPGPLASDLGIMGDKRRYGVRTRFRF